MEQVAPRSLLEWFLIVTMTKTEHTSVKRLDCREEEERRMTKKLGSLLGDGEDGARRKQFSYCSFPPDEDTLVAASPHE